jgi:hypothetical protein
VALEEEVSPLAVALVGLVVFGALGGVAMRLVGGGLCVVAIAEVALGPSLRTGTWLLVFAMGGILADSARRWPIGSRTIAASGERAAGERRTGACKRLSEA